MAEPGGHFRCDPLARATAPQPVETAQFRQAVGIARPSLKMRVMATHARANHTWDFPKYLPWPWPTRARTNLCGAKLTASERAMFTARRKQAYEALHPETVNGQNQHTRVRQLGEPSPEPAADRFTADTAAKTGQSERKVQRDAERAMGNASRQVGDTHADRFTLDTANRTGKSGRPRTRDRPHRGAAVGGGIGPSDALVGARAAALRPALLLKRGGARPRL